MGGEWRVVVVPRLIVNVRGAVMGYWRPTRQLTPVFVCTPSP